MDTEHELSFRPADEFERQEFEAAVHAFLEHEADKPADEAACVFMSYDAARGCWRLRFESADARAGFITLWGARAARAEEGPADGAIKDGGAWARPDERA